MSDTSPILEEPRPLPEELEAILRELQQVRSHRRDRERLGLMGPAVSDALLLRVEAALVRSLRSLAPDRR